jgi:phosphomethylpyrimidine synthase
MKITEDVRQYAETHGYAEQEALEKGMAEMAETFVKKGAEVYQQA